MTKNENEDKNKKIESKQTRRLIIPLSLMAVGLALVITAVVLEASHYPWGLLFGSATQNADTIPDPSPIMLEEEDRDVIITDEAPAETFQAETSAADSSATTSASSDITPSTAADLPGNEADTQSAPAVSKFVIIGTLKIPVLGVSQNVLEGAGKQMKYGVGHLPSTAAIGQKGNCVIAGHRPYPFRYLNRLKTGDNIVIKSGGHTYTYSVFDSFDVLPTEVWVLNKIPGEAYTLTLITCTPYLVSSHRLIIRARLADVDGKTPQDYYGNVTLEVTPTDTAEPAITDSSAVPSAVTDETDIPSDAPYSVTTSNPAVIAETTIDVPNPSSAVTDNLSVSP